MDNATAYNLLNCSVLHRFNITNSSIATAQVEAGGAWASLTVELLFFSLVISARIIPQAKDFYHWLSMDHVINFAAFCLLQTSVYLLSMPYKYTSSLMPPDLCFAQAVLHSYSAGGIMLEALVISYLAYLVVVKQITFEKLNAKYRVPTFVLVHGVAFLAVAIPAGIQIATRFGDSPVYIYQPKYNSGA